MTTPVEPNESAAKQVSQPGTNAAILQAHDLALRSRTLVDNLSQAISDLQQTPADEHSRREIIDDLIAEYALESACASLSSIATSLAVLAARPA